MPFRRRRFRRRPWRRRRPYRRRRYGRVQRLRTTRSTGIMLCKQKVLHNEYTLPSGPLPTGQVVKLSFQLEDLQQWGTFANLYDQYKLSGVKVNLLPVNNTNDQVNSGGLFVSSIDLDSDATISTFSDVLQCSNAKVSPWSSAGGMTPWKSIFLKPRAANLLNTGTVDATGAPLFSTSLARRQNWMDMGDRGKTKHHGLVLGWDINGGSGLAQPQPLAICITYYLQFRKVR